VNKKEDPHLYRCIIYDKTVAATIIDQVHGNVKFTLSHFISLHKVGLIFLPRKFKLKPKPMTKVNESGNVLVDRKNPIKLKVTKIVAPTKTRKTAQKAPTKMKKIAQKVTTLATLATRSSPRKKKPSQSVPHYPFIMCPPPLPLEMRII
jgi:hypothetical protein